MNGLSAPKAGAAEYRIGPGMTSLIMILVSLSMAALAILALASAQANSALGRRSQESAAAYYAAAAQVQRELLPVDLALLRARRASGGDPDTYAASVLALVKDGTAAIRESAEEADGALMLLVEAPMEGQRVLRAALRVPRSLTGPRFFLQSHVVEDDAPWEPAEDLHLIWE